MKGRTKHWENQNGGNREEKNASENAELLSKRQQLKDTLSDKLKKESVETTVERRLVRGGIAIQDASITWHRQGDKLTELLW